MDKIFVSPQKNKIDFHLIRQDFIKKNGKGGEIFWEQTVFADQNREFLQFEDAKRSCTFSKIKKSISLESIF